MSKTTTWFKSMKAHFETLALETGLVDAVIVTQRPPLTAIDSSIIKSTSETGAGRVEKAILLRRSNEEVASRAGDNHRLMSVGLMDILILVNLDTQNADSARLTEEEIAYEIFDLSDLAQDWLEAHEGNPLTQVYSLEILSISDFEDPGSKWYGTSIQVGGRLLRR